MQKPCLDFYGERLKIGDEVIPMIGEALMIGVTGFISKIEYSEKYGSNYITITDKNGNVLLNGVDSRYYTTQVRYDERENQKYVYCLIFCNDRFYPIASLPLTNRTDADYEIPDDTHLVLLNAYHLVGRGKGYESFSNKTIYSYFLVGDIKIHSDNKGACDYAVNDKGHHYPIYTSYKIAKNREQLKRYVNAIIEYFKLANLTDINNDVLYGENIEVKKFENKLVRKLKTLGVIKLVKIE